MKRIIIVSLIIGSGVLFIIFYYFLSENYLGRIIKEFTTPANNVSISADPKISNPSAFYCINLGYEYQGKEQICKFNNNAQCDAWKFFNGECGQEYTFCVKNEGEIVITDKNCQFSPKCVNCILKDGNECNEWDYFRGKCQ